MLWKVKGRHEEYVKKESLDQCLLATSSNAKRPVAKAGECEVRESKSGGVKVAGAAEEAVESFFLPCPAEEAVIILITDCWLGHLVCSKNVL